MMMEVSYSLNVRTFRVLQSYQLARGQSVVMLFIQITFLDQLTKQFPYPITSIPLCIPDIWARYTDLWNLRQDANAGPREHPSGLKVNMLRVFLKNL